LNADDTDAAGNIGRFERALRQHRPAKDPAERLAREAAQDAASFQKKF
jgi:hypothetical protein